MELDQCKLSIGPYYMHFSGYQKGDRKNTEFCEDMPLVAPTIVVFDFTDNVMRDMEVEILVVPNVDITGDPSRDGALVFEKPPTRYRNGSIKIGLDFSERGYFVGIVRAIADSGQAWESRFPFSVGYTSWYTGNIKVDRHRNRSAAGRARIVPPRPLARRAHWMSDRREESLHTARPPHSNPGNSSRLFVVFCGALGIQRGLLASRLPWTRNRLSRSNPARPTSMWHGAPPRPSTAFRWKRTRLA
uniref:Uncharacterized protein n=1 Tax=Haliea sp. ETY-M TaxID=1055105 RepID=J7MFX6_9GAMM|nr:hypothetical protein [Haliea sp. ETY-M]